jgi:hypothetical protein
MNLSLYCFNNTKLIPYTSKHNICLCFFNLVYFNHLLAAVADYDIDRGLAFCIMFLAK